MERDLFLRLCLAAVLGSVIGFERELHAKEAGVKTHILVAVGSCLFMILSIYGFEGFYEKEHTSFDPSRIAAQVVTGIGFLGAGTIIFRKNIIRGLTTAAGLWVTSAIGLSCGGGFYILATGTTLLVLLCIGISNLALKKYSLKYTSVTFVVETQDGINRLFDILKKENIEVKNYTMHRITDSITDNGRYAVNIDIKTLKSEDKIGFTNLFQEFPEVSITSIE